MSGSPVKRAYGGVPAEERMARRRRRLLEAGFELVAEDGSPGVTVSGVCRRAGLTQRYFYEQFADRELLLDEIFRVQGDEAAAAILEAALAAPDEPMARAEAGVLALIDALEADPRRVRLSLTVWDDTILRQRNAVTQRLSNVMAENAELIWPDAVVHPGQVDAVSALAVGGVIEMVIRWLGGELEMDRETLARTCARFALVTGSTFFETG